MQSLTLNISSDNGQIAAVCERAKVFTKGRFSPEAFAELEIALAETLNNCIEHAYSGAQDLPITLHFTLTDDRLVIEIIDNSSKELDAAALNNLNTDIEFDPLDIDNLPEGGFGLKIIKNCLDNLRYYHENDQNHWLLTKLSSSKII